MEPSSYFSGKVIHYDCRGGKTRPAFHGGKNGKIKMLQWNIERGYKLPGIIEELRNIDADILSIQEIDVNCERSGNIDTGVQIASELGLNYVFYQEFEEIHSPLRSSATQGGGYHGNGIFTKWDVSDIHVVTHRYVHNAQVWKQGVGLG